MKKLSIIYNRLCQQGSLLNKLRIHKSLLVTTLAPISVMTLISCLYFIFIQAPNTAKSVLQEVTIQTEYLAKISKIAIQTNQPEIIEPQLKLIANNPAINSLTVYDNKNIPISTYSLANTTERNRLLELLYTFFNIKNQALLKTITSDAITLQEKASIKKIGMINIEINNQYLFQKKYQSAIYGVFITLLLYLFALYSSLRFNRKIVDGIENIDLTLIDIGSGNLSARTNKNLVRKFGNIGYGIERMAKSINISESQLREKIDEATDKMHAYNKEITLSNHKLLKAREQADKANAAKTNFLANISHEIRTPVNGIIGFTELLLSANMEAEHKLCVQNIDDASNKLTRLIDNLLDFSKLESGHIETAISKIDIYDLAAKLHAFYSVNSKNKDVEIYLNIDPQTPRYIFTDEYKLEQIITNLLSNAIKFTTHGYVKIDINSIISSNNHCELYIGITDSGIGIAEENQQDIFHKFEQADMTTSRQYGGSGLGLSIASLLAKSINGEITVNSLIDKGSTFILNLATQYENVEFDADLIDIEVNYYDEDEYHYQHLSKLLIMLGCKVNKLEYDDIKHQHKENLLCGFKHESSANNFINHYENNNDKSIAFFSFYNADIYKQFHSKGFQHNSLRTYRLNSLINILEPKDAIKDEKNLVAEEHITAMIIDDNKINVMLMERYLQKLGVHTISAFSGSEAITLLEKVKPTIILTDLHMPQISGIDLAFKIRNQYKNLSDIPIIAVTADGASSNHEKAISSGIQEVLLKPVSLEIIMQKLVQYTKIKFVENNKNDNNMQDQDIQAMLIKQLPLFKDEITIYTEKNDLKNLYQTLHKLVGGLEYCPTHKTLLKKAKRAYDAVINEQNNIQNIKDEINNLLHQIEIESS